MRIAVSGTHYAGKSTLIKYFLEQFPEYESFDEPYWILEESGHEFSNPPAIEEYEEQLDFSLSLIKKSTGNTLFDRSPVDFLSYAFVTARENGEEFDTDSWVSKIEEGLSQIDLVLFLPVEDPDIIRVPRSEDQSLRLMVDEKLKELILDDSLGLMQDIDVLEVTGTIQERMRKIRTFLTKAKN